MGIVYNKEKCRDVALQCSSISEFSKKFSGAYQNCLKYGWLDEVCSHIKRIKRKNGYWNNENVIEEAKKYSTLKEFRKNSQGAYDYASKNNLMDNIKAFLEVGCKPIGYWTYERCLEEAKKYETLIDFHNKSSSAYTCSRRNNWLEKFTWLKSTRNKRYGKKYSIEELNELSNQCINRAEFKEKYYHAWNYARKNKLMEQLEFKPIVGVETYQKCSQNGGKTIIIKPINTNKVRVIPKKWTYEKCVEESKKYEYYHDFMTNSPSAYTTACYRGWLNDFTWLVRKRKAPNYWTEERCYEEAKKYDTMEDFILNSFTAYSKSRKKKWHKNYTWLKSNAIGQEGILTYDVCYNEALKYNFMSEFRLLSNSIYSKACKTKWIRDYTWLKKNKSFLEAFFEKNLIHNNIDYEFQKTFTWLKMDGSQYLDFYLPDYNIAVECQGGQHYGYTNGSKYMHDCNDLIVKRDENKRKLCEEHDIRIIYYALKVYDGGYFTYTNVEELFRKELNIDFKWYSYSEIKIIENREKKVRKFTPIKEYKAGCEIIQKDLNGNEIKRWKSIDEICTFYKCSHSCILAAIKGINHTGKGFVWECDLNTGKYVYEIDENGNVLHKFNTPEEASRFYNICNLSIRERCNKENLKPFKGHIFTYHPGKFDKAEFAKIDKTEQKPAGYWTYERCFEEAKKYTTYTEFVRECPGGCTKAYKMGWLKEWKLFETHEKITFERCTQVASEYERIEDFKNEHPHLYEAMLKNGWVRKIFKYTGRKIKYDEAELEQIMCEAAS